MGARVVEGVPRLLAAISERTSSLRETRQQPTSLLATAGYVRKTGIMNQFLVEESGWIVRKTGICRLATEDVERWRHAAGRIKSVVVG